MFTFLCLADRGSRWNIVSWFVTRICWIWSNLCCSLLVILTFLLLLFYCILLHFFLLCYEYDVVTYMCKIKKVKRAIIKKITIKMWFLQSFIIIEAFLYKHTMCKKCLSLSQIRTRYLKIVSVRRMRYGKIMLFCTCTSL